MCLVLDKVSVVQCRDTLYAGFYNAINQTMSFKFGMVLLSAEYSIPGPPGLSTMDRIHITRILRCWVQWPVERGARHSFALLHACALTGLSLF